jgi:hypothetical protein
LGEADTLVLSGFSSELDIAKLMEDESRILDIIEAAEEEENEDYIPMDTISNQALDVNIEGTSGEAAMLTSDNMDDDMTEEVSRGARKTQKQLKKKVAKAGRRGKQVDELDDYNFASDFK